MQFIILPLHRMFFSAPAYTNTVLGKYTRMGNKQEVHRH